MSHFPQYSTNSTNNETNQFNMQGLDANVMKSILENNGNVLAHNINPQDMSYMQQNKMPNQYIITLPNNGVPMQQPFMMPLQYGNIFYVNQPSQFPNNESGVQYNGGGPVLPIQLPNGVMQMDINDLRKLNQQTLVQTQTPNSNPSRSRKRSYSNQLKQELSDPINATIANNDEVLRDTRNRPLLYSCPDCSRKFSMQSRLTQHKKCHLGIRPFACSSCNLAFTQKSYLVRHAAVHKDERPYTCELCQKTYKHYGSLANHRKTHKNGSKSTESQQQQQSIASADILKTKMEEIVDMNNNNNNNSSSNANAAYLFQNNNNNNTSLASGDQSFHHAPYANDLFASAIQSQLLANLPPDINASFINPLNFHNGNFYSLNFDGSAQSDATTVKRELAPLEPISDENNSSNSATANNNNNNSSSSISAESSSQPINLT